ncbi:NAD(P)-binding protein [Pedobacter sp. MR2016-19]|uniref:protoporphyrinogen/coproporphyrinogen oxidase n=1 Tax=Pedobacter sp. MR2016-19 TaxID=2780089 RepID=UPI00187678C1|nr:NAD(P)-binding protein [Pedobacter sp. MR2016-19]MBE5322000.1 NAD(P)-binding protein [Pedobacter sp. MR2016-19]
MKIGILGAGISGLSVGRLLSDQFEIEILERQPIHGGIARTKEVDGVAYHPVGGHCFNSKNQEVLDFVFNNVLSKDKWHNITRNAVIKYQNEEISYPIEFAVKEIHHFDEQFALDIVRDFLNADDDGVYPNLEDWFRKKFGNTLSEKYFLPYNEKIWNRPPREMSHAWVEGKLPIPNKKSFFNSLIGKEADKMPHSSFFYPDTNNQNTFIDALAEGLNITYNFDIKDVKFDSETKKWTVNGDKVYDIIISTLPLNVLPKIIDNAKPEILAAADKLRYNKVTTMLWKTQGTDRTWTYVPEKDNFFHRYIHIGNFYAPSKNYSITEVVGHKTQEEMIENGKKDSFLIEPVAYNVSEHAYVVFDENYDSCTSTIKDYLEELTNIYTLGRFGEWQYYNMDICIEKSIALASKIKSSVKKAL